MVVRRMQVSIENIGLEITKSEIIAKYAIYKCKEETMPLLVCSHVYAKLMAAGEAIKH